MAARPALLLAASSVALAALTLALPSTLSYDPWAWVIWGREIAGGELETAGGPSWKPLPVLLTAPFSVAGDAAPWLWLVVARAGFFAAIGVGAALAYRLAGAIGALAAGLLLATSPWLWAQVWLGNSEGLLVLAVLLAVWLHLERRPGAAFACAVAASLVRPEAWPFLCAYAAWVVWRDRRRLPAVVAGLAVIPVLWLGPELLASGDLWRAADRAQDVGADSAARSGRPALAVLEESLRITPAVARLMLVAGLLVVVFGRVERTRATAAGGVAVLAGLWLAEVAVMTELGFSGITRYLLVPHALMLVLAGVAVGWLAALVPVSAPRFARVAAPVALGVLLLAGVARTLAVDGEPTAERLRYEARLANDLDRAVGQLGGADRLERCPRLHTSFYVGPAVAWRFERPLARVDFRARTGGALLRAAWTDGAPLDPPPAALTAMPDRRVLARTAFWEISEACR